MITKYVKSQKELNELIDDGFDGLIVIKDTIEFIDICENGKASIEIADNATIHYAYGNAIINIYSPTVKIEKARDNAILICYAKPQLKSKSKLVKIINTEIAKPNMTITKFIDRYQVEFDGKDLILYKSVNPDNSNDFKTGTIKYEIGKTVEAPDWDSKYTKECGRGLHLSPTPFFALKFNVGKVLRCRAKRSHCKTVSYPQYPEKIRCKKVEVLSEVDPKDYF
jgi:predicted aspartyl protease